MIWEYFKTQSLYGSQPFWVILRWAFVSIIAHHVLTDLLWSNHKGIFTQSCDSIKIREILREKNVLWDNLRIFMWMKSSHYPPDISKSWDWAGFYLVGYTATHKLSLAARAGLVWRLQTGNLSFNDFILCKCLSAEETAVLMSGDNYW